MVYCSLFACILSILAQIKIDLPIGVPITLQTLGIYLIALYLKPKLAFITTLTYLLMGIIGLPVFHGFKGGIGILLGPTGGYIFAFPFTALLISYLVYNKNSLIIKIISLIIGTCLCYFIGTLWFVFISDNSLLAALSMCVIPFIPGDIVKMIIALFLINKIKKTTKTASI